MKEFKLQTDIKACQYIHTYRCSSNKDITCETKTSRESVWVTSALLTYANMLIYRWYGMTWRGQIQYHVPLTSEDMSCDWTKFRLVASKNLFWQCSLKMNINNIGTCQNIWILLQKCFHKNIIFLYSYCYYCRVILNPFGIHNQLPTSTVYMWSGNMVQCLHSFY